MTFVALWRPAPTGAASAAGAVPDASTSDDGASGALGAFSRAFVDACLAATPHLVVRATGDGGTLVWADARGLSPRRVAARVLDAARVACGAAGEARVGVSRVAVAAEVAAREGRREGGGARSVTGVEPRLERAFLAPHAIEALVATGAWDRDVRASDVRRAASALAEAGLTTCGALAALAPDAVAVRLGAAGAALWRLARADDPRRIFAHAARALPSASLEWTTYELRDPERLAFVAHRLVQRVVDDVRGWGGGGEALRTLVLRFALGDGGAHETTIRGARPSADAAVWSRLVRAALERVTLPDGVTGLAIRVEATSGVETPQGDLFDRGFGSDAAAEAAVARLIDAGVGTLVRPARSGHALPERRVTWQPVDFRTAAQALRARGGARARSAPESAAPRRSTRVLSLDAARAGRPAVVDASGAGPLVGEPLALRLLPEPRPLAMTTAEWRGVRRPLRYRERAALAHRPPVEVVAALGPDCLATGRETGAPVAREYWQCLTADARLVLLYRDAGTAPDAWFLQGWWD